MIVEGMIDPPKWISSMIPFQRAIVCPKHKSYAKVMPPGSWYTKLPKMGSKKLFVFHLPGLVFWIFFMLKMPLEPHFNIFLLRMRVVVTSLLRDKFPPFQWVFHSVFLQFMYISIINKNCALLYLCVSGNIFVYLLIIFFPSFCSQNNQD